MFVRKQMKRLLGLSAALVVMISFWSQGAVANDFVVISSNVSALSPGKTIAASEILNIPALRKVVLVNASGRTVVLKGPRLRGNPGPPLKAAAQSW